MSGKVDLDRWGPHLRAAQRSGKTLTQYASERGLSRHTLYAARQMLSKADDAGKAAGARRRMRRPAGVRTPLRAAFAPVRVLAPVSAAPGSAPMPSWSQVAPRLRAQLLNGVAIEVQCASADTALVAAVICSLAGLPCSA